MLPLRLFFTLALTVLWPAATGADAIHTAAHEGNLARVETLVSNHPGLADSPDSNRCCPVHFAAGGGHVAILTYLAQRDVALSPLDADGNSPLHWAASEGRRAAIDWLLDHGLDVNARNHHLGTPLLSAVKELHYDTVEHLVRRGADIEIPNEYGRTPLLQTTWGGGDLRMVQLLLRLGADVNARDRGGATPLNLAAWRGFKAVVNVLLEHGAEVEVEGHAGQMLLSVAVGRGIAQLYQRLVARDIEIPLGHDERRCWLHRAARGGSHAIVVDLIGRGADVDQADYYGWTPLHYAAAHRRPAVTAELLRHVEDPSRRTRSGYSALNLAREKGGEEAAQILQVHGADAGPRTFPTLTGPYLGQSSPGIRPLPFAPDIVATPYDQHGNITFSPDGREAFWASSIDLPDSGFNYGTILCSREVDGRWIPPRMATFATERQGDDVPFFSPDGQRLYFLSHRPPAPGEPGGKENIWVVAREGDGWGEPEPLPPVVNRFDHHWQISVAANGNLYFHSRDTTAETQGVYLSRCENGQYLEPEPLGFRGRMPYIAPDESYLITFEFGEPRERNLIRFRAADGGWGAPVDLTAASGGNIVGTCPMVSPDGHYFFFVRAVYQTDNTWWVTADSIEELREHEPG